MTRSCTPAGINQLSKREITNGFRQPLVFYSELQGWRLNLPWDGKVHALKHANEIIEAYNKKTRKWL
jgi:hypothetical protein